MKLKFRISLIVIAIVVFILVGMSVVQMRMVSEMSIASSKKQMQYLTLSRAEYWKGRFNGYLETIRAVADIMANYDTIPVEVRRERYDDMLYAAFTAQPDFIRVYSIWKPNALDGMDSRYIGRIGSSPIGQYAMTWGRDTDQIIATPNQSGVEI